MVTERKHGAQRKERLVTWWSRRAGSFAYAWRGLRYLIRSEWNFRIHLAAATGALAIGWVLRFDCWEWLLLVLVISQVLVTEALNTVLERLTDLVQPEVDSRVALIKDVGSAAVLLSAVGALVVGVVLVVRRVLEWQGVVG